MKNGEYIIYMFNSGEIIDALSYIYIYLLVKNFHCYEELSKKIENFVHEEAERYFRIKY